MGPGLLSMSGRLQEDMLMQQGVGRTGVHRKGCLTGIGDSDVVWGYVLPQHNPMAPVGPSSTSFPFKDSK